MRLTALTLVREKGIEGRVERRKEAFVAIGIMDRRSVEVSFKY